MEGLGLAGVFTCVSPLWSRTVQVPENTATHTRAVRHTRSRGIETVTEILFLSLEYIQILDFSCTASRRRTFEDKERNKAS